MANAEMPTPRKGKYFHLQRLSEMGANKHMQQSDLTRKEL